MTSNKATQTLGTIVYMYYGTTIIHGERAWSIPSPPHSLGLWQNSRTRGRVKQACLMHPLLLGMLGKKEILDYSQRCLTAFHGSFLHRWPNNVGSGLIHSTYYRIKWNKPPTLSSARGNEATGSRESLFCPCGLPL